MNMCLKLSSSHRASLLKEENEEGQEKSDGHSDEQKQEKNTDVICHTAFNKFREGTNLEDGVWGTNK